MEVLNNIRNNYEDSLIIKKIRSLDVDERYKFVLQDRIIGFDEDVNEKDKKNALEWYRNMSETEKQEFKTVSSSIRKDAQREAEEVREMDNGAFAAMLGYDAINADGHGESGSYTVVLNRTKAIFLKGE